MKILLYSNQGLSPAHLGMEMELLESLINQKHKITIVKCNSVTGGCFFNPTGNILGCAICEARSRNLHRFLKDENVEIISLPSVKKVPLYEDESINTFNKIENLTYNGIAIGRGVLSSAISITRDYNMDSADKISLVKQQLSIALKSIIALEAVIKQVNPDKIYLFNGRFSETAPLISYCSVYNIPFATFEVGVNYNKLEIFEGNLPHSIAVRQKHLYKMWGQGELEKQEKAIAWYKSKVTRTNEDDTHYTSSQEYNLLPTGFDNSRTNIAIFNSSEDEMKTIQEWKHNLFENQNEAIQKIISHFENKGNFHFYLRVHPNLNELENSQMKEINSFDFPNLTIIGPNEKIDTYALMNACDKIISFGSTTGIEATFHQKPSIVFGSSFYQNMDAVYEPKSYEELYSYLSNESLQPKRKESTYPFAYYISNRGITFNNFEYDGKYNSKYKGEKIRRVYPLTFILLIKYLPRVKNWFKNFKVIYKRNPKLVNFFKLKL